MPDTFGNERKVTRRNLFRRGAVLMGGLALAAMPVATLAAGEPAATRMRNWYALQPTREDADSACRRHAANKLFADPVAADLHRAHPGCKCRVVQGGEMPEHRWIALFGDPSRVARQQADRRWEWVAKTLA